MTNVSASRSVTIRAETSTSAPARWTVPAVDRSSERDELESLGARDGHPARVAVDADERAGAQVDLLVVDAHPSGAADDEVDLFLPVGGVVVLPAVGVRRQREVVEAEGTSADRP